MLTVKIQNDSMLFYDGEQLILSIEEKEVKSDIHMTLKGELRSETALYIQDELEAFATIGIQVIMDFKNVTFISKSAIYALVNAQQTYDFFKQKPLILRNVPVVIYQFIDNAGYAESLQIEE